MNTIPLALGSLVNPLKSYPEGARLFESAGPVSDAFIASRNTVDLLNGPVGSGKTTACIKRALLSAVLQPPMADGVRRYNLTIWRETYDQMWRSTIPSWQKVLNPDKGIGHFTGARPRSALHKIHFQDAYGMIELSAYFLAFGDDMEPDDLGGFEITDAYLDEMNTNRYTLFTELFGRVGRTPNRAEINLPDRVPYGRIFGSCNAPAPDNWCYKEFWERKNPNYKLFRQPGGLHPEAENLKAVGRGYYLQQVENNKSRSWWIKIKVHNEPGYNRENDTIYADEFIDSRMVASEPLAVSPHIPVVVGIDGGLTPAAAFTQTWPNGQFRVLDEVALERGSESDLARAISMIMAQPRFAGCEFYFVADPAMAAGEETQGGKQETSDGSPRQRLEKALGQKVHLASTNVSSTRIEALRTVMTTPMPFDTPAIILDPSCLALRRGFNATYHYNRNQGTGDRSSVAKTPDSHVMEGLQYAALKHGSAEARQRAKSLKEQRQREREKHRAGAGQRYNPISRKVGR